MRPGGGKAKGSGFENTIAKTLTKNLEPLQFKRSQQSGAIVGGMNSKIVENFSKEALRLFVGDVVPINETECERKFRFTVETKFYKDADKLIHLLNGNAKIYKWIEETETDAEKLGIEGIVIYKFNQTPIMLCTKSDLPDGVNFIVTANKYNIALFDDVIKHKDWWLTQ